MNDKLTRAIKIGLIVLAFSVVPAFISGGYQLRVFTLILIFAMFSLSLNVVFGHTDQLFLFTGGLGGISAYLTVIAANAIGVSPWITIVLGTLFAGLVGAGVSYIAATRRFTVVLIAVFTLTIQLAIVEFFVGASSITGGSTGLPVDAVGLDQRVLLYYLLVGVLLVFLLIYDRIIHSHFGLAFDSIREDELAAESVGIRVVRYKVYAGLLAGSMIGLTGALYGFSSGNLTPAVFSFTGVDVTVLIMLTVGGMRTMYGPILGAVFIYWLQQVLASYSQWRLIVFGTLLVVLFLYFREGIVPKVNDQLEKRDLDLQSVVESYT